MSAARPSWGPLLATAVLVGLGVGLVYRATLLPDVGLWDTAEAQTVPPILGTMHPTGYPAYVLLGWLATVVLGPIATAALAMNALSAACLAVAAGATVIVTGLLTGRALLGVAAGLGFGLTPVAWRLGTAADVHALHVALVALLLAALVAWDRARMDAVLADGSRAPRAATADRWLLAAAALYGLALADHRLALLLAPGIAAYVLVVEPGLLRRRRFLLALAGLSIGLPALLYLELPIRAGLLPAGLVYGHPDTLGGFLAVVLGTQFAGASTTAVTDPAAAVSGGVAIVAGQLGPLAALVVPAAVVVAIGRPRFAVLTVPGVLLTVAFDLVYDNAAIERYWAVPLLVAWIWLAVAAGALLDLVVGSGERRRAGEVGRSRRPALVAGAGTALATAILLMPTVLGLPGLWRDTDASDDIVGRRWLEAVLAALPQDAVVVSWWSYSTPLWYAQQVEHRRLDLRVVDDRTRLDEGLGTVDDVIDANLGRRPVFLIRADQTEIAHLIGRYRLGVVSIPVGESLLRVDGRQATP